MSRKYVASAVAFSLFSVTTVVIVILLNAGVFVDMVGSVDNAIKLYGANTILLIISTVIYIWQKAHRHMPARKKMQILEAFVQYGAKDRSNKIT